MKRNVIKLSLLTMAAVIGVPAVAQAAAPSLYINQDVTDFDTAKSTSPLVQPLNQAMGVLNAAFPVGLSARARFEPTIVVEANALGTLIEAQATAETSAGMTGLGFSFDEVGSIFAEGAYSLADNPSPYSAQVWVELPLTVLGVTQETVTYLVAPTKAANPLSLAYSKPVTLPGPGSKSITFTAGPASLGLSATWSGSWTPSADLLVGANGVGHASVDLAAEAAVTFAVTLSAGVSTTGSVRFELLGPGTKARAGAQIDAGNVTTNGDPTFCAETAIGYQIQNMFSVVPSIPSLIASVWTPPSFAGFSPGGSLPSLSAGNCTDMKTGANVAAGLVTLSLLGSTGQAPPSGTGSGGGGGGGGGTNLPPHNPHMM